jgi:hypothetical protein
MSTNESHRDYPAIQCPLCERLRKPISLNKDGSVTYSCPPDHDKHGDRYTWRIAVTGEVVEKW